MSDEHPCRHAHLVPVGDETPCAKRRRLIAEAARERNIIRLAQLAIGGAAAMTGIADPNIYMEAEYNGEKIQRVVPVWMNQDDSSNKGSVN